MKWADIFFEPINLPIIGSDPNLIPDADCDNCRYGVKTLGRDYLGEDYCYMFENSPGSKCGQFQRTIK
ncbi:hypothetical protein UFOVP1516_19 [uncultured Caudovirales phage]|uniref:Uncharacterized protein n=1 Tax=uncultured Caudovirales phage TaxID=2100421 RepID=A0A6J7XCS7_9CAUD|nr:hypothetical protein UFOVP887_25 [uncultured Caudovirales phage]CAB5226755.1 hypothetical protein UFOVP1516_19 [uncultured Caudovirales phage]